METSMLKQLVQTMITLKNKLQCPICLDVILNLVELECGHRYCAECYSEHKTTKQGSSCPLCKAVIRRRFTLYKDNYADSLGKFVREICDDIRHHYNCEVEELQRRLDDVERPRLGDLNNFSTKDNVSILPSTSKARKSARPESDSSKENSEDAFDKLMKVKTSFNKNGANKVYTNKNKQNKPLEIEYKTVNDYDKRTIMRWLSDTRNAFDRLTQTQNIVNEGETDSNVSDLVSISQLKECGSKEYVTMESTRRERAKSLDIEIKNVVPREKLRYSVGGRLEAIEKSDIEQINIEEEKVIKKVGEQVLLDLIEDECLNKLDSELEVTELASKNKVKPAIKKGKKGGSKWERKGKIDKSIKIREKEKLNITLQSTQGSRSDNKDKKKINLKSQTESHSVGDGNNTDRLNTANKGDKNVDENMKGEQQKQKMPDFKKPNCIVSEKIINVNNKSYDLNKLEEYISNNIKVIERNTSLDDSITPILLENNQTEKRNKDITECTNNEINLVNETSTVQNTATTENKRHTDVLINIIDNLVLEEPVAEPSTDISIIGPAPAANNVITLDDTDIELYEAPTQVFHYDCQNSNHNLDNPPFATTDTLNLLEETVNRCLTNLNATKLDIIDNQLTAMLYHISKLRKFIDQPAAVNCDAGTQTEVETVNVKCQTEVNTIDVKCQTQVKTIDVKVQTQVKMVDVNVQVEAVNKVQTTQTEEMECPKCRSLEMSSKLPLQEPKNGMVSVKETQKPKVVATQRSVGASKSQNDIFTGSFDNLVFDTQEIVKNQGVILRSVPKEINHSVPCSTIKKRETIPTTSKQTSQHLPASVLVCSLDSTSASKKVNRKLTYEPDRSRFKRIRTPTSDSDSDGEIQPKKACNRFVKDDLTVEFQTNPAAANDEPNSENIDYDDYLAEVMKKYEENSLSNTSTKDKPLPETPGKIAIKQIVTKCEEMISEASKSMRHIKEMAEISSSSKDSFQTASQSINNFDDVLTGDNVFVDENLEKLENDIRDYERENVKQNTESPDVIVDTDEICPLPKKSKRDDHNNNPQSASLFSRLDIVSQKRDSNSDKVCSELNDSFHDARLGMIDVCGGVSLIKNEGGKRKSKINIIENVVIRGERKGRECMDEDLFSDEDIVETTPQKKKVTSSFKERSILSQIYDIPTHIQKNALPTPLVETEHFDFDFTALPPPPDFQDNFPLSNHLNDNNDQEPIDLNHSNTLKNLYGCSLTPDGLSQVASPRNKETKAENDPSLTPDKLSQLENGRNARRVSHSTPLTRKPIEMQTLGFSPIKSKDSQQSNVIEVTPNVSVAQKNPSAGKRQPSSLIDLTHSSKYTPLSFVSKNTHQKQNILTSTPRQKSIWNFVRPFCSKDENEVQTENKPRIAFTRISKEDVEDVVSRLTEKNLATHSEVFDRSVTHMIVSADEYNCVKEYTTKFVCAVAAGIWVLRFEWVKECLRRNCIVPEEPYEVLDSSGCPGPRTSRLTRKTHPLFRGYEFYCADPFAGITKAEIKEIIVLLGGEVVANLEDLRERNGNIKLIVMGEGQATEAVEELFKDWIKDYKTVSVDPMWLIKCVCQYNVVSIRPYIFGVEDDILAELNYPPHLMEPVPLTLSESY